VLPSYHSIRNSELGGSSDTKPHSKYLFKKIKCLIYDQKSLISITIT
jgi:hypothetical protein